MTGTMSQHIDRNLIRKAQEQANKKREKILIYKFGTSTTLLLSTISQYEKSSNQDSVEIIAIIDEQGDFVHKN